MNQRHHQSFFHVNVNIDSMEVNVIEINGGITTNVDVSVCEIDYVWNPSKCICKNGKYLASIMDDSMVTCD